MCPGALGGGEELVRVPELGTDVEAAAAVLDELGADRQLAVDVHGAAEPDREVRGDRREAVPGGEQTGGFVERSADEATVDEPGPGLVVLAEREGRAVRRRAGLGRLRKVDPGRVVATPPAGRVVVRRDAYRRPPRSKCALKKFSDPAVAIAADAEISSASVAAATICAKR